MTSHPQNINSAFICCSAFRVGMTRIVPPELSSSTPAGKSIATMLLGRMSHLAMDWVKKWSHLWQGVSVTSLLRTIMKGIARGFYRVALVAPLEKTKKPSDGKELGRDECNMEDGEKHNLKVCYQRRLILNTLESYIQEEMKSLVEGGRFGESLEQPLNGSICAEMQKMHLEERHRSKMWLRNPSISIDFGTDWGDSSEDDMELEDAENSSQKWVEGHNHPQEFRKGLSIGEYFGKTGNDSCSHQEEFKDLQEGSWQGVKSPSISQQPGVGLGPRGDFVMHVEPSNQGPSDSSKNVERPEAFGKDSLNLDMPTVSCGYKESLVQSLFYSPSEEEDDDDSEDWSSEDEMEDSSQSGTYVDGGDSGNRKNSSEEGNDYQHQEVLENHCGSFFTNNDPLHSKPVQALKAPTIVLPEPKQHKEITVSFYLKRTDSKPKEFHNGTKQSWPQKHPRSTCRPSAHKCCQLDSRVNCDSIKTERSSISQEENQVSKKVRFSPVIIIHPLLVWDYASRAARYGPWEEMARDRCRFRRRIAEVGAILEPCLGMEHRAKAWKKIHGIPGVLQEFC